MIEEFAALFIFLLLLLLSSGCLNCPTPSTQAPTPTPPPTSTDVYIVPGTPGTPAPTPTPAQPLPQPGGEIGVSPEEKLAWDLELKRRQRVEEKLAYHRSLPRNLAMRHSCSSDD